MQPIIPHLWFDNQAKEAAEFYTSLLPDSEITYIKQILDTPSGDCDVVEFVLAGQTFMAISAGDAFKFNPSISFMINFDPSRDADAAQRLDEVWKKLVEGGSVLMELQEYPFSKRYGWVADRFGLSWQLILTNPEGDPRPVITPSMMFTGTVAGKAEEAIDFYCGTFKGRRGETARYPGGMAPDKEGTLMYADFQIDQTWIAAMDSAHEHGFKFNEAISLLVPCDNQSEIDELFNSLSADPKAEQCGWLKDKYGVSWQITSSLVSEIFKNGSDEEINRVMEAFQKMKKVDVSVIEKAYRDD